MKKGEGTSPEQEQLVHNLLHSGGKFLSFRTFFCLQK